MSYTVFARKYRPQTFDDVVGQEHITTTLKNAIEQNRLAHAYIFIGPRGTGKTSTARILAKALNCVNGPTISPCGKCDSCVEIAAGRSMNVLEFDAASNTQVEKIREIIIDNVKYMPTGGARYKIYIVDEVHMLSTASFNALLKTLEEPPEHVKFVFATTNVEKVPTTILSRCQRFDLKRIPTPLIASHLLEIASKEGIALSHAGAETLARGAEGGMRDAESMLDQLVAFCGQTIEEEDVLKIFGFTAAETVSNLCEHLINSDLPQALGLVHEQAEAGKDLTRLMGDLIAHLRNLLVAKADPDGVREEVGDDALAAIVVQGERIEISKLLDLIEQFAAAESRMKWAPNKKMHFEIGVIRAVQTLNQASLTDVIDTLTALRDGREITRPEKKPLAPPPAPRATPSPAPKAAAPAPRPIEPKPAPAAPVAREEPPAAKPVAESAAPAPAAAPAATPTLSASELWPSLLAEVRRQRPLIAMWVEAGTLLEISGNTATVGFPPESSLALEYCDQPNNRKLLEDIASQLFGQPLKLRFIKREGLVVTAPQPREQAPQPTAPADPMEEFKNDPLIRKALDLFRAEIT